MCTYVLFVGTPTPTTPTDGGGGGGGAAAAAGGAIGGILVVLVIVAVVVIVVVLVLRWVLHTCIHVHVFVVHLLSTIVRLSNRACLSII